ncbi:MAG: hypothetical protein U1F43_03770 [Myxococcota bacterium]
MTSMYTQRRGMPPPQPAPASDAQASTSKSALRAQARGMGYDDAARLLATDTDEQRAPVQARLMSGREFAALPTSSSAPGTNEHVARELDRYAAAQPLVSRLLAGTLPQGTPFAEVDAAYHVLESIRSLLDASVVSAEHKEALTRAVVAEMTAVGEALGAWYTPHPELGGLMQGAWDQREQHDMTFDPQTEAYQYSEPWAYDGLYSDAAERLPRETPVQSAEEFEAARVSEPGDRWREGRHRDWLFSAQGGMANTHAHVAFRIYLNPLPDHVGEVMDFVFGKLGCQGMGAGRSHRMKTTEPAAHGTRTDSVVVYIGKTADGEAERDRIIAELRAYQEQDWPGHGDQKRAAMFADRRPPLTEAAKGTIGVGWGEQPDEQGTSFGQVRLGAIEGALGDVMNDQDVTRADFMRHAARKLIDLGIDPKDPAKQGEPPYIGNKHVPKRPYGPGERPRTGRHAAGSSGPPVSSTGEAPVAPPRPERRPKAPAPGPSGGPPQVAPRRPPRPGAPSGGSPPLAVPPGPPQAVLPGGPPPVAPRERPSSVKAMTQRYADLPVMGMKPPAQ